MDTSQPTIGRFLDAVATQREAVQHGPPAMADCCVFVRDVCKLIARTWRDDLDPLWCIHVDADGVVPAHRVFGPVHAAAEVFGSAPSPLNPRTGARLSVVQGWHSLQPDGSADTLGGDTGHTWFWLAAGLSGNGIRIDSSRRRGVRVHDVEPWADVIRSYRGGFYHCPIVREDRS